MIDHTKPNLNFDKIEPASLRHKAYITLQKAIIELDFKPGELLKKSELCKSLGISRTPLSEAIALLVQDGLVEVVPQAGTYVARFSIDELKEGAFIREALEVAAIKKLASSITDQNLIELRRNLRLQRAYIDDKDIQGFYGLDSKFHSIILNATGFRKLSRLADTAWMNVNRVRRLLLPVPGRIEATYVEHKEIFSALEQRDTIKSEKVLKEHLRKLMTFVAPLEKNHPEYFLMS
jgi:DNA-binding GntR family transcriptional regulator